MHNHRSIMSDTLRTHSSHTEATPAASRLSSPKHTIIFAAVWAITQLGILIGTLHYASYDQVHYLFNACGTQDIVQDVIPYAAQYATQDTPKDIWLLSHLVEYPLLYTWPVTVSAWLSRCDFLLFTVIIRIIALGVATVFTACLVAINYAGQHRYTKALWLWYLVSTTSYTYIIFRLDILVVTHVSLAIALSALCVIQHSTQHNARYTQAIHISIGVLLGIATMYKAWPVVLAGALVGAYTRKDTWLRLGGYLGTVVMLCVIQLIYASPGRIISFTTYQHDRSLNSEAVAGTPLNIMRMFGSQQWEIDWEATSNSVMITGPYVDDILTCITVIMYAAIAMMAVHAIYMLFRGTWTPLYFSTVACAYTIIIVATNKVFSTQFTLWITGAVVGHYIVYLATTHAHPEYAAAFKAATQRYVGIAITITLCLIPIDILVDEEVIYAQPDITALTPSTMFYGTLIIRNFIVIYGVYVSIKAIITATTTPPPETSAQPAHAARS